ncbi:MAG: hypothetical protein OFPII_25880 [Osedax symbiont Rs1]|nr:MAG: hypothetical protein OFPII_25880 [Osedax symbiont Rs1]
MFEAETDNTRLRLNYGFEKGILHSSSQDNYLDHNLNTTANIIGNSKNRIDLKASLIKGHEARGDEDGGALTTNNAPLEYDLKAFQGIYTYGGREATGQVVLEASYQDKEFTNFRSTTFNRDYDQINLGATFKYRISDKTQIFSKITSSDINYDNSNKDSTNIRYLIGADWDATAKTSGSLDIGWSDKNFKDSSLKDSSGGTWDANIDWNPKTYSTFTFRSGQEFGESTTTASHIDTKYYGVSWDHYWKDKFKTIISYDERIEDFSGSTRKDTTDVFVLGLNYEARRWLNWGLGYTFTDKDSNLAGSSFKKNTLMFTVQSSL